ncbi:hypothetical protein MMC07_009626 [Pseudocyphellaria aurata]|nr:hypothetical protein [Pseudocyphellaria aurata]
MLETNARSDLGGLYGGCVLTGSGASGASNLTPIYISEIAPLTIARSLVTFVGLYEFRWQAGGLVGFWINVNDYLLVEAARFLTDNGTVWH